MAKRRAGAAAVVALVGGLFAPQARAEVATSVSLLTPAFSYPSSGTVSVVVDFAADSTSRFNVGVVLPSFVGSAEFGGQSEGSVYGRIDPFAFSGAALVGQQSVLNAAVGCTPSLPLMAHGYEPSSRTADVTIPAGGTASLRIGVEAGGRALWPGASTALTVVLSNRLVGGGSGTLPQDRQFVTPEISVSGPRAAHVELATVPESRVAGLSATKVPRGEQVAISGTVTAGSTDRVRILLVRPEHPRTSSVLTTVDVDANGRFAVPAWRPPAPGLYEVYAETAGVRAGYIDDYSCPRSVEITERAGPAIAPAGTTPLLTFSRVTRTRTRWGAVVRFRATCQLAELASARCRRTVRVKAGGDVYARRRIDLAAGKRTAVTTQVRRCKPRRCATLQPTF